jgi:heme/copper-type cytochrome/quinol oxidase subunit 2
MRHWRRNYRDEAMNSTVMMVAALAWIVMLLSLAFVATQRLLDRNEEQSAGLGNDMQRRAS